MAGSSLIGNLAVDLTLETAAFVAGSKKAKNELDGFAKSFASAGERLTSVGTSMTVGITAPFAALVSQAVPAAIESRKAIAQVEAALASMGPAGRRSAEQLEKQAAALQSISTFDDDDILVKVTANMLTFGKVTGDVFDKAQLAAVNLSARLGTDLQGSAIMIGKALNDPIKGVTALTRVGVSFTAQQKEQIKAMADAGDVAGAQRLILGELEKQYGGAAKAARDAAPGSDTIDAWREFQETVGDIALRVLPPLTDLLTTALNAFNSLSPGMQTVVVGAAALAAGLGPVLVGLGGMMQVVGPLIGLLGSAGIGGALAALAPFLLPIAAAAGAVYLAWKNWDTLGPALADFARQAQEALGPPVRELIDALIGTLTELWNGPLGQALRTVITTMGSLWLAWNKALGGAVIQLLKALLPVVTGVIRNIGDGIKLFVALLTGDWAGAWTAAGSIVERTVGGIGRFVAAMVTEVTGWLMGKLGQSLTWVTDKVKSVGDAFYQLYDRVVGNSYVPDMVDEIGQHMARLDKNLAAPVQKATDKATQHFQELQQKVQPILDRLFPDQARANRYAEEDAALAGAFKGQKNAAEMEAEARRRLREEYLDDRVGERLPIKITPTLVSDERVDQQIDEFVDAMEHKLARPAEDKTARVVESFAYMGRDIIGSLDGMVRAIKSGDFFAILDSVLDVVSKVAGAIGAIRGAGGGGPAPMYRAGGGGVSRGRPYIVGERGPELFMPSANGGIMSASALARMGGRTAAGGGAQRKTVVYDMRGSMVSEEVMRMIDASESRAIQGGAGLAISTIDRQRRNSLGLG